MRKRNNRIWCRLNDEEYYRHQNQVRKSGLSQEAYLRKLINGNRIKEAPPIEYQVMINQLVRIGNNLNQIAARANSINEIEHSFYKRNCEELQRVIIQIEFALR